MSAGARPLSRLLVANRGEIACRIIDTAHRLGLHTIALAGLGDRDARHVRLADEAVDIAADAPGGGYLAGDAIIAAARECGADAIHPGYGFLAEDPEFARACTEAGLVFVGPPAAAVAAMGDKLAARQRAAALGVPVPEAVAVDPARGPESLRRARELTLPVMVKPVAGGGGKGMLVVASGAELGPALERAAREAAQAFGDARLMVEPLLAPARHVEVQVVADAHGGLTALGTRECSLQRRRQKVIEEAPAPALPPGTGRDLVAAALTLARGIDYRGVGTVEFLVLPDGRFRFLEMNTRLQVEHRVTELVYGVDLVEWQLRSAAGEPLAREAAELEPRGHAIEARLCAEDPARGFLPQSGRVALWRPPPGQPGLVVDSGVDEGDAVVPHYDPLFAKVVAHGHDRDTARRRLRRALRDLGIGGVTTNRELLLAVLADPAFAAAPPDTGWLEREATRLAAGREPLPAPAAVLAALALVGTREAPAHGGAGPWAADAFRPNLPATERLAFTLAGEPVELRVRHHGQGLVVVADGRRWRARVGRRDRALTLWVGRHAVPARVVPDGAGGLWLLVAGHSLHVGPLADRRAGADETAAAGEVPAPMPGEVVAVHVAPGDEVSAGQALVVLSAMKMEHTLTAPCAGTVTDVRVTRGERVAREGLVLVTIEPRG